jgi:hypothetical protein
MGDPSKEVTEEDRDEAVAAKAKAMEAMAEGEHGPSNSICQFLDFSLIE